MEVLQTTNTTAVTLGDVIVEFEEASPSLLRILELSASNADKTPEKFSTTRLDANTTGSLLFTALVDMVSDSTEVRKHAAELYSVFPDALGLELRVLSTQEIESFRQILDLSKQAALAHPELAWSVVRSFVALDTRIDPSSARIVAPWFPVLIAECRSNGEIAKLKEEILKPLLQRACIKSKDVFMVDGAGSNIGMSTHIEGVDSGSSQIAYRNMYKNKGKGKYTNKNKNRKDSQHSTCGFALQEYVWPSVPGLSTLIPDLLIDLAVANYDLDALCQVSAICAAKEGPLNTKMFARAFLKRLYTALSAEDAVPPAPNNTRWSCHTYWLEIEACACLFASVNVDKETAEQLFSDQAFILCAFVGIGPKRLRKSMHMMFINYLNAFLRSSGGDVDPMRERALKAARVRLLGFRGLELFGINESSPGFSDTLNHQHRGERNHRQHTYDRRQQRHYSNRPSAGKSSHGSYLTTISSNTAVNYDKDFAYDEFDSCPANIIEDILRFLIETASAVFGMRSKLQLTHILLAERLSVYANERYPALYRRCVLSVPATSRFVMHPNTVSETLTLMNAMLSCGEMNIKAGMMNAFLRMFAVSAECIPERSGYQQRIFWLACTCLATANVNLILEATRLLRQVFKVGHLRGSFRRVVASELFLAAKPKFLKERRYDDANYKLQLSLPSTEENFHLALAILLLPALRMPETRTYAIECCELMNICCPNELIYCMLLLVVRSSGLTTHNIHPSDTLAKDHMSKEVARRVRYEDTRSVLALSVACRSIYSSGSCVRLLDFVEHLKDRRVVSAIEQLLKPAFSKLIDKQDITLDDRISEWSLALFSHSPQERNDISVYHTATTNAFKHYELIFFEDKLMKRNFTSAECNAIIGAWPIDNSNHK